MALTHQSRRRLNQRVQRALRRSDVSHHDVLVDGLTFGLWLSQHFPRLLEMPGMVAVISELPMANGYTADPIAYFAEKRPPPDQLTADWPRRVHVYTTQLGEEGWSPVNDAWDFDLGPWLTKGKVRWCPPESARDVLSSDPPDGCPYVDLPGRRERIIVQGQDSWGAGLPTGEDGPPIDD